MEAMSARETRKEWHRRADRHAYLPTCGRPADISAFAFGEPSHNQL